MSNKEANPFISHYGKHNISPVRQDITDFNRHLLRREKLFRILGIPRILFSNRTILEVGPGGGYNSLAFFEWGANVDFVEPNPKAHEELPDLLDKYNIARERWNLFRGRIEDYDTKKRYDVIIAEGLIPGLYDRKVILSKITKLISPGGVIVVTCMDDLSYFFEVLKRVIGQCLLQKLKIEKFEGKVEILSRAFSSHLKSLKYSSRLLEDWVMDNCITPVLTGKYFSIAECIEEFGDRFTFLGSSPSMFTDYSWYKDVDFNSRKSNFTQFYKKRHVLMLYDMDESVRTIEDNEYLVKVASEFRHLAGKVENNLNEENVKEIVKVLHEISRITSDINIKISDAINEGIMLLLDQSLDESKISNATNLSSAFGRGQQYVSMIKC